jgi:peptide chain release factor 2
MLIDDLRENLKSIEPDISTIKSFWAQSKIEDKFKELDEKINEENFWQNTEKEKILEEHRKLKPLVEGYSEIVKNYQENVDLVEMFSDNEEQLASLSDEVFVLCRKISKFKIELLLNNPEDAKPCYMSINSGAGGTESQDWASMLVRMYLRFCEREGFKVETLDYQSGEEAGIKSCTLYIKGKNAYGFLKAEAGVHRLVRISPFDSNKRRHTSFAAVNVTPEVEDAAIEIKDEDLRVDTYRSGGAGGQHVNKTESAIRITHIPSGIVVQCQNDRSQGMNRQTAMKMLRAKLMEKQEEEKRAKADSIEKKKIEWGSQIRSYVLHPYKMVKDHRTDLESPQPEKVLDGEIMLFIQAYLLALSQA